MLMLLAQYHIGLQLIGFVIIAPYMSIAKWHSDFIPPNGTNRMKVNIPALNTLFEQGQESAAAAGRTKAYQGVCSTVNAQLPWDVLWSAKRFGGASKKLVNFVWTPAPGGGRYDDQAQLWDIK